MNHLRVIDDGPRPGAFNMAEDARLLAAHRPGGAPVLRLYRWAPPAVSCGRNQRAEEFDPAAIAALGYDLVRRPTGGRAILHAEELTYAVVGDADSALFGRTLHETYATINRALLRFLGALGIDADVSAGESREAQRHPVCFRSAGRHEIRVGGRKLIGSAQRRTGGAFLQHGSVLTGPAHAGLVDCLAGGGGGRPGRRALLDATTDLARLRGRPLDEADHARCARLLAEACGEAWGLELSRERGAVR